mgnify:CR=1 FL=1
MGNRVLPIAGGKIFPQLRAVRENRLPLRQRAYLQIGGPGQGQGSIWTPSMGLNSGS